MDTKMYFIMLCGMAAFMSLFLVLFLWQCRRRKNEKNHICILEEELKKQTEQARGIYERLLPGRLLDILGVKDVSEVSTGLQRSFEASVLHINILDYMEAVHTMDSQTLFTRINQIFAKLIPVITEKGGTIAQFHRAAMSGIYIGSSENALSAAVSLCEAADGMKFDEKYQGFSIGLAHGSVMFGIVGHDSRLSAAAMSECMNLAEALQEKAGKYGARILITSEFAGRIQEFEKKFNSRLLGYFYDSSRKKVVQVYDVYDGNTPERKQSKRKGRMLFEKGVKLYVQGSCKEARLYFAEVLKADRNDLAAREYLYLCDKYSGQEGLSQEIYLECI